MSDYSSSELLTSSSSYSQSEPSILSASDSGTSNGSSPTSESGSSRTSSSQTPQLPANHNHAHLGRACAEPLYDGADISVFDSFLLIFQFALRHSLTSKAFSELLQLLGAHLPLGAKQASSVYSVKKYFLKLFPSAKAQEKRYCGNCHRLLQESDEVCTNQYCSNASVEKFMAIPVGPQLKAKMEDPQVWKMLKVRCPQQRGLDPEVIRDVYDGKEYLRHHHFLSKGENVSLLFNTDGVALFRSSKVAIWPIWTVINELPPNQRFLKKNMLLVGLWYSREKPTMTTYLKPFVDSINELLEKGVSVSTPDGEKVGRAILLQASLDLPARAIVFNMKQYNGRFACIYCNDEGVSSQHCPMHRWWPYKPGLHCRSDASVTRAARKALMSSDAVKGIKGPSALFAHSPFHLVKGCVIDNLHAVFLGVVLSMLHLWFDDTYKRKHYSLRDKIIFCDKRLLNIAVPDSISRPPKSLQDFKHWKGSELRSWLFYYSLPVLHGVLPATYLSHFALLVAGIYIFNSDCITKTDFHTASKCLLLFYQHFSTLYGPERATMNFHMLLHIPSCVRDWGPMWCYSCFAFESMNGHLKKLFHGSRNMSEQLAFSFVMMQMLPSLPTLLSKSQRVHTVAANLFGKKSMKKKEVYGSQMAIVGQVTYKKVSLQCVIEHLVSCQGRPVSQRNLVQVFHKVMVKSDMLYSSDFGHSEKRNSFTVMFTSDTGIQFGQIQFFFQYGSCISAVIRELKPYSSTCTCQDHFGISTHALDDMNKYLLQPVCTSPQVHVVHIDNIIEKCVCVQVHNILYVCQFPNHVPVD